MSTCPICQGKHLVFHPARFSDFIANRVFNNQNQSFSLCHCRDCGYAFYNYRFSDEETAKLYHNYRDNAYQRQRQQFEPFYSAAFNQSLSNNPQAEKNHRAQISKTIIPFLSKLSSQSDLSLLDFGGDKGQLIPPLPGLAHKYVYDISGVQAIPGVTALSQQQCSQQAPFDIILCCHVLEHVADPKTIISQIRNLLRPNGLLYLELPFDSPFSPLFHRWKTRLALLRNPNLRWKDLLLQYFKKKSSPAFQLHEHINFFTLAACQALLTQEGFTVLNALQKENLSLLAQVKQ